MSLPHNSEEIIKQWLSNLRRHISSSLLDDPRYYLYSPQSLVTTSRPQRLLLGTSDQVLISILPAFQSVQHEILFVTCFWAHSASQRAFASALRALSARGLAQNRRIRVRIAFSSCSLWQKLTQTSSLSGKMWPSSTWAGQFGLPDAEELRGLDITIRSVFVWPLSVMHSKFVVLDRERLFLPSCNVSWEEWFEGCVELQGDVVGQTLLFWGRFWGRDEPLLPFQSTFYLEDEDVASHTRPFLVDPELGVAEHNSEPPFQTTLTTLGTVPTILLPSPHHRNPCFRPLPFFMTAPSPPPTPLNLFLLTLFEAAKQSIYIQSANVTSQPVLDAILSALQRGIDVQIVSNRRMQVAEQLITAGRLTEWALRDLWREYTRSRDQMLGYSDEHQDLEAGTCAHGTLEISYYRQPLVRIDEGNGRMLPIKSHLKLTVVDEEIVVLGSGNMDRASWYTSQELGVAFFSRELAAEVMDGVRKSLGGCLERAVH